MLLHSIHSKCLINGGQDFYTEGPVSLPACLPISALAAECPRLPICQECELTA